MRIRDLADKVYLFESAYSPDVVHVRLDRLALERGAPTSRLGLADGRDLVGDVTDLFTPAEPFTFAMA